MPGRQQHPNSKFDFTFLYSSDNKNNGELTSTKYCLIFSIAKGLPLSKEGNFLSLKKLPLIILYLYPLLSWHIMFSEFL